MYVLTMQETVNQSIFVKSIFFQWSKLEFNKTFFTKHKSNDLFNMLFATIYFILPAKTSIYNL